MSEVPTCAASGCSNPARSKELCMTHYMRLRRNGDPNLLQGPHEQRLAVQLGDRQRRLAQLAKRIAYHQARGLTAPPTLVTEVLQLKEQIRAIKQPTGGEDR